VAVLVLCGAWVCGGAGCAALLDCGEREHPANNATAMHACANEVFKNLVMDMRSSMQTTRYVMSGIARSADRLKWPAQSLMLEMSLFAEWTKPNSMASLGKMSHLVSSLSGWFDLAQRQQVEIAEAHRSPSIAARDNRGVLIKHKRIFAR
jgi:hypothetical protein